MTNICLRDASWRGERYGEPVRVKLVASLIVALALAVVVVSRLAGDDPPNARAVVAADAETARPDRLRPAKPARGDHDRHHHRVPSAAALRDARQFAAGRTGLVSFAVINSEGQLRGDDSNRRYLSASVVKAMLLAAELRRLKHAGEGIDASTDSLLTAMITRSDNDAADAIYARVGDQGLFDVAERVGMTNYTVAGHWGNSQITAADMARFFGDLDRVFVRQHREYAKGLLGSVIAEQSWGIPAAAGARWAVRFKGGWLPDRALVHQAAELRARHSDRELAIAVLTDSQPSFAYGVQTVTGIAARLLARHD
jgi:hypothetical protein